MKTYKVKKKEAKLSMCLIKHHAIETHGEAEVQIHTFLNLALHGDEGVSQLHAPTALSSLYQAGGPRADLDAMKRKISDPTGNQSVIPQSSIPYLSCYRSIFKIRSQLHCV